MLRAIVAMTLGALLTGNGADAEGKLGILVPMLKGGEIARKQDPSGAAMPILQPAPIDSLQRALIEESRRGTVAFLLQLDARAQRASGQEVQPTWLMLTEEEGGFAKRGFWLHERGQERFVDQPFVALVVDATSVADGSFEEIFAHEAGHLLLRRLIPDLPPGMSRTAHGSLTLTDDPTAFDEGFAIHFQALSRLMTRNAALRAHDAGLGDKPLTALWQSNVDGTLRIDGLRRNWFIHRQVLPPGDEDAWDRRANSSAFDIGRLKNGNQMTASEGVVATVFYRALAPHPALAQYGSLFRALQKLSSHDLQPDSPLLPLLAQSWLAGEPSQGARFAKIFVETTYGATVDRALPQAVMELAQVGRLGKQQAFVDLLKPARAQMAALLERVAQHPGALSAALAPALWLASTQPLVLNLNTAEADQLSALDGSVAASADKIVAERDAYGPYSSLSDLVQRLGLSPELASTFNGMAAEAVRLGPYKRL